MSTTGTGESMGYERPQPAYDRIVKEHTFRRDLVTEYFRRRRPLTEVAPPSTTGET